MKDKEETRGRHKLPKESKKVPIVTTRYYTPEELEKQGGKKEVQTKLRLAIKKVK